jgi:transcriptional regulator with XRE-family HTH domain
MNISACSTTRGLKSMTSEVMAFRRMARYKISMHSHPNESAGSVGDMIREWRAWRRFSQLALADAAEISTRHLSYIEGGRSAPSRDVLMRLAGALSLGPRVRNRLLHAGGYAPVHGERALDTPDLATAHAAVRRVLDGHVPFPALAVDRQWCLVAANDALVPLLEGVAAHLLAPPVNVLRLSLHPDGLAPRIVNLAEWRHHVLERLHHDIDRSRDPGLAALHRELLAYPCSAPSRPMTHVDAIAVPLVLASPNGGPTLSFLSTTTIFGTAIDITLAELTLECFYPADDATRDALLAPKDA